MEGEDETVITEGKQDETAITEGEKAGEQDKKPAEAKADEGKQADTGGSEDGEADEGEKPKDGETDKDDKGAPAEYETFTVPEGMEVDKEALAAFAPLAKELKLTQEQAQKFVDLQSTHAQQVAKTQQDEWASVRDEWRKAARADKEIGGERFGESAGLSKKALDVFGTPELAEALKVTGTGDHPEFVRFFARVGKAVADDKISFGQPAGEQPKSRAQVLFSEKI